jgi:transcription-repair coupling factor (superfamily II helicase)
MGSSSQPSASAIAWRLAPLLEDSEADLLYVASSERRADETARALAAFSPQASVLLFPPWDCLPYDRAPPSRESMGRRMTVLGRLLQAPEGPRIVVTSAEAIIQRLPPLDIARGQGLALAVGQPFDRQAFEAFAARTGYIVDDRVDEPGEIALRGNVVEVFPAADALPVRITDEGGSIQAIMRYDPRSQRTLNELTSLDLGPASELVIDPQTRLPGAEHRLMETYSTLATLFDYLPDASLVLGVPVPERIGVLIEGTAEAYEAACDFGAQPRPRAPADLYLDSAEWAYLVRKRKTLALDLERLEPVPAFSGQARPDKALGKFIADEAAAGHRTVMGGTSGELKQIKTILRRAKLDAPITYDGLDDVMGDPSATIGLVEMDLDSGFGDDRNNLTLIAAADVLGSRIAERPSNGAEALLAPLELRVGDVVVHEDRGVGILTDLTPIATGEIEQDTVRLQYHSDATLMVPVGDFGRLWRYGAEADVVTLDRLNTDSWMTKRAKVSAQIDAAAEGLVALARTRLQQTAEALRPPKAEYQRLSARFPYPETSDQAAAIAAVLDDLASGRPMNRLICGDVGFGKTEVALRAATAAALAGKQVAVIAPTTVLARQHAHSFERRFAGTDIVVAQLSRLNSAAEAAAVKDGLRSRTVRIVVGTHAVAAEDVEIPDLGLLIIDEEQRFGAKLKQALQELANDVHVLAMSATPIPRTLQSALVGLQDVSIIATPPARRRPIRTLVAPFDEATAHSALLREHRRGGQSFVVVPRIQDIEAVGMILTKIVPDLVVISAHGDLPAKAIDEALVGFANGAGDIMLATNIVESGLDVPRANTMLIWRADWFGLSQLHQLRGRVGRGRAQGVTYLFTDPATELAEATRARLSTLEAFDRLGSGFEISARDLELRGAGDLLGEDQAGHVHLIGSGLYQQMLEKALRLAKGEVSDAMVVAQLNLGDTGAIPVSYVPEPVVRINLYARLQRLMDLDAIDELREEFLDRFGERPPEVEKLLAIARLRLLAGALGIAKIDAGPAGIALTFKSDRDQVQALASAKGLLRQSGERLVLQRSSANDVVEEVAALLDQLLER